MDDYLASSGDPQQQPAATGSDGGGGDQQFLIVESTDPPPYATTAAEQPPQRGSRSPSASLSWSPMKVPNLYSHVPPRYLEYTKAPKDQQQSPRALDVPKRETFPINPAFRAVSSRYATVSPARSPAGGDKGNEGNSPQKPKDASPLENWSAIAEHRKLTQALGFGGAQPKYVDLAQKADKSQSPVSPRRLVERLKEERKEELHWRQTCSRKEKTFDELLKENPRLRTQSPSRKSEAPSQVGEYLRNGTPIKHYSQAQRSPSPASARGDSPGRQASGSPSRSWHSGGVTPHGFDELRKKNAKLPQYSREEARVREERERLKTSVRPANFVPRVAKLAPVYLLPEVAASPQPSKPAVAASADASPSKQN